MPEALFVSDVHLNANDSVRTEVFKNFLMQRACTASVLYVLGDLFEFWLGDDFPVEKSLQPVLDAFFELQKRGTKIHFIAGNRDFLLGDTFMRRYHWNILPQECLINIHQQRVLLMHGDTLCTDDIAYQRFRRIIRSRPVIWLVSHLPQMLRRRLAHGLRNTSSKAIQSKQTEIMDVNQSAVQEVMRKHSVTLLIHGHTHRPAIHHFTQDNEEYTRIVLGDWHASGIFLSMQNADYKLETYP